MKRAQRLVVWLAGVLVGMLLMAGARAAWAQNPLPNFLLDATTNIVVNVTMEGGQTLAVPIDLLFAIRSEDAGMYMTLDATTNEVTGATITVQDSAPISAAVKALVYRPTVTAVAVVPPTLTPTTVPVIATQPAPTVAPTQVAVAPPNTPLPPATATVASGNNEQVYSIGDDVMTGNIKWRVISSEDLGNRMESDNEFVDNATTGGRFMRVVVEIDNRGSEPAAYWTPEMLDAQGRTFNEFSEQYFFVPDEQECLLLTLNPGLSKQCTHIYEVAGDAQGLKLKVTDFGLFFGNEAIILLQ